MSRRKPRLSRHTAAGVTLIELMVSMAIGLIVVLATLVAYLGASDAAKVAEVQARMNEDGQAALAILSQQLRMAGSNPKQSGRTELAQRNPVYLPSSLPTTFALTAFAIRGCDGKFQNIALATSVDSLVCGAPTADPDSIAVTYEADAFNTVVAPGTSQPTDCLGDPLTTLTAMVTVLDAAGTGTQTAPVTYHVADNRYYIGTSAAISSPSLYCKGNGTPGAARPLVENVENLQITYGTVPALAPTIPGKIAGYLDTAQLATELAGLPTDAARWDRVVSARICVVVRSIQPAAPDLNSARYARCDGSMEDNPPDRRLRRAYSTTVTLRNRN